MKALVLSGGGSRGSWQAGAIKFLGEVYPEGFDLVTGTSVGAINATGVAMYRKEDFPRASEWLHETWINNVTSTKDIWQLRFPLGIPALWNPSVGTNKQLEVLLDKLADIDAIQNSGVQVRYSTVDMLSGDLVNYTGEDLLEYGVAPIMASASYPMAFPPVQIGEHWLSDGGLRDTAPVGAALEAGATEVVVVTTRNPYDAGPAEKGEMSNVATFGLRCLSLMFHETVMQDVKLAELYNRLGSLADTLRNHGVDEEVISQVVEELDADKKVIKVTVYYPSNHLGTSLDFSKEMMQAQMNQGYQDAWTLWTSRQP